MAFSSFSTFNTITNQRINIPTSTPVNLRHLAKYNFENGANDSWNTNHATDNNGLSVTSALFKFGNYSCTSNAVVGSTQYISTPSIAYTPSYGLSISLWLYRTAGSTMGDSKLFEFTAESIMMWTNPFGTLFNFANGTNISITTGVWNNIIITITSSGAYIVYLNGANSTTGTITALSSPLPAGRIGRSLNSGHYSLNGYIDDFRIYNTVLTQTQVTGIYNNTFDSV